MNENEKKDNPYTIDKKLIYLDNAASSDPEPEVLADIMYSMVNDWHNPSSIYQYGRNVRLKIDIARDSVRRFLNADDGDTVVFTSGGTESNNLALRGCRIENRHGDMEKGYVVSAVTDHPSVYNQEPWTLRHLPVDGIGRIDMDELELALKEYKYSPIIVCVTHVNNETGVIQDVRSISDLAHQYGAVVMADCAQSVGHMGADVKELGCDVLTFTSEKIGMPRGCGVLWARKGIRIDPLMRGGNQENGLRPGTEAQQMIIALGKQLDRMGGERERALRGGREYLVTGRMRKIIGEAADGICDIAFNTPGDGRSCPGIISVRFDGINNQHLLTMLDQYGVQCSAGSACSAGSSRPSRVLMAMGLSEKEASETLRFSFDYRLSDEEITEFGKRLRKCLRMLKGANL